MAGALARSAPADQSGPENTCPVAPVASIDPSTAVMVPTYSVGRHPVAAIAARATVDGRRRNRWPRRDDR